MFPAFPSPTGLLLAASLVTGGAAPEVPAGAFLEARNAAVWAGPCHYNSELTTAGDRALLAWSFERGSWDGVALAGLCAAAAVDAERNLGLPDVARSSVLFIDARADAAQAAALRAFFEARYGALLGELREVRAAAIALEVDAEGYRLELPGAARLRGLAMPDRACCSMPEAVWYRPLAAAGARTEGVLVGFTTALQSAVGEPWVRNEENDAFLGRFSL